MMSGTWVKVESKRDFSQWAAQLWYSTPSQNHAPKKNMCCIVCQKEVSKNKENNLQVVRENHATHTHTHTHWLWVNTQENTKLVKTLVATQNAKLRRSFRTLSTTGPHSKVHAANLVHCDVKSWCLGMVFLCVFDSNMTWVTESNSSYSPLGLPRPCLKHGNDLRL